MQKMKIEDIDKNFKAATVGDAPVNFYSAHAAPFVIEGFPWRKEGDLTFYRLPRDIKDVNDGAMWLSNQTSGGAVRFRTDAKYIAIRAKLVYSSDMNHMPRAGSAGFDIYRGRGAKANHVGTAQPNRDQKEMEQIIYRNSMPGTTDDYRINLPLYGGCEAIEIGVDPDAKIMPPTPHKVKLPVFFYGSSITQGGCASRPGNAYTSMLCRAVDAPQVNLGFSGSGKGEITIAKAMAKIPMAAFVFDYDYNAPTPEHLKATHEKFFKAIRAKQPDVPVIMLSACNVWYEYPETCKWQKVRRDIIYETYANAVKAGDRNVYFIDGRDLFGKSDRSACTVDGCHPNDLGFYRMYQAVLPVLRKVLKNAGK